MQIKVTGRNIDLTQAIKDYALSKAQKLEEFYTKIQKVEVVLEARHIDDPERTQVAEFRAWLAGKKVVQAIEGGRDIYAAIDLALAEIERQIKKHKEKHSKGLRRIASRIKHLFRENLNI
ncbi:MAG: ribosome-associated translation inhibitor RaiA [bacterium]